MVGDAHVRVMHAEVHALVRLPGGLAAAAGVTLSMAVLQPLCVAAALYGSLVLWPVVDSRPARSDVLYTGPAGAELRGKGGNKWGVRGAGQEPTRGGAAAVALRARQFTHRGRRAPSGQCLPF